MLPSLVNGHILQALFPDLTGPEEKTDACDVKSLALAVSQSSPGREGNSLHMN